MIDALMAGGHVPATSRPDVLPRAFALGVAVAVPAVLGHLAGGGLESWPVLALLVVMTSAVAWALRGHEWRGGLLLALIVGCQAGGHVLLSLACTHARSWDLRMLAAHLVAMAVTGLWLREREIACWFELRTRSVRAMVSMASECALAAVPCLPPPAVVPEVTRPVRREPCAREALRRGPPVCLPV